MRAIPLELRGHRGPGKSWRLDAEGRPFLAPAWDGDGAPVYQPTGTLVPPPRRGPAVVFVPLAVTSSRIRK